MDALLAAYSDDDEDTSTTVDNIPDQGRVILHSEPEPESIGPTLPPSLHKTGSTLDADEYRPPVDSAAFQAMPRPKPTINLADDEFVAMAKRQKIVHTPVMLDESRLPSVDGTEVTEKPDLRDKRYFSKKEKELDKEEPLNGPNSTTFNLDANAKMGDLMKEYPVRIQRKVDKKKVPTADVPTTTTQTWTEHTNGVTCVRWSRPHGNLLASASMDNTVKIYDVFRSGKCVLSYKHHNEAVRDMNWNVDGKKIITAGFDKYAVLTDVETGKAIQRYKHKEYVTTVTWHPKKHNLFLAGGFANGIACWDVNSNSVVSQYTGPFATVQAVEFINDGQQFVSSSDVMKRNSTDKGLIVWDFETCAILSNQVYVEAYSCPSVRAHPREHMFVAQSNGNYIAMFSSNKPYKMNKYRRFEGHRVQGYHIKANFSPDGTILTSGSAEGGIFFFNYHAGGILNVIRHHRRACLEAAFHPVLPAVVATACWDGTVAIHDKEKK